MNSKQYKYDPWAWESEKMATTETDKNILEDHRIATFEELGFSNEDAKKLSETKHIDVINDKSYTFPLSWHRVKKMLDAGCSHELALKILL